MNKKNFLKMSILFATLGILAFSLIPTANTGAPPFMQGRPFTNNLAFPWFTGNYDFEFSASEDLYFRLGWISTHEELENDWAPKHPYKSKLFINNEEITLKRFEVKVNKTVAIKGTHWYHIFGPGYFTAGGEYLLRGEFWVRRPYQGDGKNYWRIYVDYGGFIYGVPDYEFRFEYPLNIIE